MRSIDGEGSDRPNAPSCKAVQLAAVGMAEGDSHGQCIGGIIGLGQQGDTAAGCRVISCTCFFTALP